MVARVIIMRTETDRDSWLHQVSDRILACKAQQHAWPKIKRSGRLPRGIRASGQGQGVVQLEYTCPDCGTVRVMTTGPGGAVYHPRSYRYTYPDGYAAPKGADLTRREYFDELWRRTLEEIQAQAAAAANPPAAETG